MSIYISIYIYRYIKQTFTDNFEPDLAEWLQKHTAPCMKPTCCGCQSISHIRHACKACRVARSPLQSHLLCKTTQQHNGILCLFDIHIYMNIPIYTNICIDFLYIHVQQYTYVYSSIQSSNNNNHNDQKHKQYNNNLAI